MHVSINDPRAVTHAGPSVDRVCSVACMKAIMSSSIDRERGKGVGNGNRGQVYSGQHGLRSSSVSPPTHPELLEILTLTVVEDTNSV